MAKQGPEQEAFKQKDKVDERQDKDMEQAAQNLHMEAYAAAGQDKTQAKAEKTESFKVSDASLEASIAKSLRNIAELASRLPDDMRADVVANNQDFIHPSLMAVVKNPKDFQLNDMQRPEDVMAFLAKVQSA